MPGRRNRSGGYREPSSPAAVSGPGQTSQRTDGTLPKVDLTGFDSQRYGQRQELEGMATQTGGGGGGPAAAPSAASSPAAAPDPALMDVFRPSEGRTAAPSPFYDLASGGVPDDPDVLLRAMYEFSRHPDILRLLDMRRGVI